MTGTSFSVTNAMRWMPPRKMSPAMTVTAMPITHVGMPSAFEKVSPMEFDCTMLPMKPSARVMATAKKPARNLPKPGKPC